MDDRARRIDETNSAMYGREAAEKVHRALHEVGGLEIPREFVFMDRAAIGLGAAFLHLGAELNWRALFEASLEGFDEGVLAQRLLHRDGFAAAVLPGRHPIGDAAHAVLQQGSVDEARPDVQDVQQLP